MFFLSTKEKEFIGVITVTLKEDDVLSAQQYIEKIIYNSDCDLKQSIVSEYNNPFQMISYSSEIDDGDSI